MIRSRSLKITSKTENGSNFEPFLAFFPVTGDFTAG